VKLKIDSFMKAKLLMVGLALFALSSIAIAQDQTQKAGCCKEKTECCKAKDGVKPACCDKTKATEKTAQKAETSKPATKTVEPAKQATKTVVVKK
jgi:hypothetical protein